MKTRGINLNPTQCSTEATRFEASLRERVVGQDLAVRSLASAYQVFQAGLSAPGRPVCNLLLLGPTGCGKTRLVEAASEALYGSSKAVVKIDCGEIQHSHEIAKLVGSPPGYLGHRETQPLITQEALEQFYTDKVRLSLVLFDEIEKASDGLWQLLLAILDKATVTLGDNRRVDFSRAMIFLTSNLGSREMAEVTKGGIGFSAGPSKRDSKLDQKLDRAATEAARRKFSPEFMNRMDKVVVFRALGRDDLEQILDIELRWVQERITAAQGGEVFVLQCTAPARQFLLTEGTDPRYGARHLKRAIERLVVFPLSSLLATGQVSLGDVVIADYQPSGRCLSFSKERGGAVLHAAAASVGGAAGLMPRVVSAPDCSAGGTTHLGSTGLYGPACSAEV
jgi:ATP-dependent Clp protease ATP-binding subunit ClpB